MELIQPYSKYIFIGIAVISCDRRYFLAGYSNYCDAEHKRNSASD